MAQHRNAVPGGALGAQRGQHFGQMLQQLRFALQAAARPAGATVAVVVIGANGIPLLIQPFGHVRVAAGMFAQTMHEQNR